MNQEQEQADLENKWLQHKQKRTHSARRTGVLLLLIGGLLLARAGGVPFPAWFFSWPVLLMAIGLMAGVKHNFRNPGWLIPFAIGALFLTDRLITEINLRPYIWPVALIGTGMFIIFRPKHHYFRGRRRGDNKHYPSELIDSSEEEGWDRLQHDGHDMVDITAIFGGVKKNVLSKNFKGGDIVSFMGGAEINLTQADFTGKVTIDSFNMFGGTKLIIPADWEVQSNMVAIFGGIDDKRSPVPNNTPTKILYLDGTCLFGGIEIKSY